MRRQRALAVILALAMLFSVPPAFALADRDFPAPAAAAGESGADGLAAGETAEAAGTAEAGPEGDGGAGTEDEEGQENTEAAGAAEDGAAALGVAEDAVPEGGVCASCGAAYDNGVCTSCGAYQPAEANESGCYEIGNAGQLFWFAALVNGGSVSADAVLTADIDVNPGYVFNASDGSYTGSGTLRPWTPVGNSDCPYSGCFDGNGHTISGIYISGAETNQGLFGYIRGTVCNVTISNSSVTGSSQVGGVVGYLGTGGSIGGCVNRGYVRAEETSIARVGGIAGYIIGGKISDCANFGAVSGPGEYVGGIAGMVTNVNGAVTGCYNAGTVSGGCQYVGGVVGYITLSGVGVVDCSNSGSVTGGGHYVGGVVGCAKSIEGAIMNCANEGEVHGDTFSVGGIVGFISSTTVAACRNSGAVSGGSYVGGVTGSTNSKTCVVTGCCNSGSVSAGEDGTDAGGIVGKIVTGAVNGCYNVGMVSGDRSGGVVGYVMSPGTVANCYYLDTAAAAGIGLNKSTASVASEAKTAEAFASGEVAWLLNGGVTDGTQIWYQTLGEASAPSFSGAAVYQTGGGYSNTESGAVYSVDIVWGSMAFTYQEAAAGVWNPETHAYEAASAGWTCGEGANELTVTNRSETAVDISVSYGAAEGYAGITGSFDVASPTLEPDREETFALHLSGTPDEGVLQALEHTVIGTVTVTIAADE